MNHDIYKNNFWSNHRNLTLFECYLFIRWPLQVGFGILLISIQWSVGVIQKTKPKTENCSLNFFCGLVCGWCKDWTVVFVRKIGFLKRYFTIFLHFCFRIRRWAVQIKKHKSWSWDCTQLEQQWTDSCTCDADKTFKKRHQLAFPSVSSWL